MRDRLNLNWMRLSLSTRLNLITASVLLLTMAVFVALDYAREHEALLDAEAERLATLGTLAARRLSPLSSVVTEEQLRAVASASAERPVTVYLARDGRVVLSSSERNRRVPAPKKVGSSPTYDLWRTSTGLAVSMPYRPGTDSAGELFVEGSLDPVKRVLHRTLRMHVVHGLATVLAMTLGVGWVLQRAVHRPFARMISAMNVMERGTWELDVPASYQDEVGILTTAFNRMGKKLTRTALAFARAERLAAYAVVSTRLRRQLDSPLREIDEISLRLMANERSREDVEAGVRRVRETVRLARSAVENLDDVFLAELNGLNSASEPDERPGERGRSDRH